MANQLEEIDQEEVTEGVPPYPDKKDGQSSTQSTNRIEDAEPTKPVDEPIDIDVKQLSYDLVEMSGKIWKAINPKVREFTPYDCRNIATPLVKVMEKYDLTKYMKYACYIPEITLLYNTYNVVMPRVKELKDMPKEVKTDAHLEEE